MEEITTTASVHLNFESAEKEIKRIIKYTCKAIEELDLYKYFLSFSDSPDFVYINEDGLMFNYQEFCAKFLDDANIICTIKNSFEKEKLLLISRDSALHLTTGQREYNLKNGLSLKYNNFGCTTLWKKINDQWKIIYFHESTASPILDQTENHWDSF